MLEFYYALKNWLSIHWRWLILALLAIIFFLSTASYNYFTQSPGFVKWSSPDESANYFISKHYAETGELAYSEPDNLYAQGIIMPRSFRSDGSLVKPVSFLGLILIYGNIARIFGAAVLPYLTPIFAALGLIFFYLIVKRLFQREVALIATFLLSAFPVYCYFSARSMFHNVLFVVLWLAGLYFSLRLTDVPATLSRDADSEARRKHYFSWLLASLAGFLTGLAATVRTSELLWLLPVLGLIWIFNFYRLGLVRLILFVYFFCLAFLPIMHWNTILYGGPTASGYPQMTESLTSISSNAGSLVQASTVSNVALIKSSLIKLRDSVFYFGFQPYHSAKMVYYYIVKMFPWLLLAAILGFFALLYRSNSKRKNDFVYLTCLTVLSAILIFYYGSWVFSDNPDAGSHTIGNSYTRYWLPIYLGLLPLAALIIARATAVFKYKAIIWASRVLVVGLIMASSIYFVLYGSEEGLVASGARQIISQGEFQSLLALTPSDAVIITRYHDKLLFPERRVIVGLLTDDNMNKLYKNLVEQKIPVFYYNFTFSDKDFNYLNRTKLGSIGLKLEKIKELNKDFTLYKLVKMN